MFYRKWHRKQRLNRPIGGIIDTPPMLAGPPPRCLASLLANSGVTMQPLSLKSFRTKLGRGRVAAISDRDMPSSLRELEDIASCSRRRGGARNLLFVLDRSESDHTIQLAADTLTVGRQIDALKPPHAQCPMVSI